MGTPRKLDTFVDMCRNDEFLKQHKAFIRRWVNNSRPCMTVTVTYQPAGLSAPITVQLYIDYRDNRYSGKVDCRDLRNPFFIPVETEVKGIPTLPAMLAILRERFDNLWFKRIKP